ICRATGALRTCKSQLISERFHAVIGQRDELTVESVRLHDVRARFEIAPVNLLDDLRLSEIEQLVVALEILALPIAKAFAAKLLLTQLVLLDGCTHRAVDDDDAFAKQGGKWMEIVHD